MDFKIYNKKNFREFIAAYPEKINDLDSEFLLNDSSHYISNIQTNFICLNMHEFFSTALINHKEHDNSLICSPYTLYSQCILEFLEKIDKLSIRYLIRIFSLLFGWLGKITKINQVVQVNNNLHCLVKHPKNLLNYLPDFTNHMINHFPQHAILFQRVNNLIDRDLLSNLKKCNYVIFPDRLAHIFQGDQFIKKRDTKRDLALIAHSNYKIVNHEDIVDKDIERIFELYQFLFIKKHSKHNPQYTIKFFENAIKKRWHHYMALRNPNGVIDVFASWFYRENIMICGPTGYDTQISPEVGLFRMIIGLCLQHAYEKKLLFNMGSGSDTFKLNRGSTQTIEYTAIYCKHLPEYRKIPWKILQKTCTRYLEKFYRMNIT